MVNSLLVVHMDYFLMLELNQVLYDYEYPVLLFLLQLQGIRQQIYGRPEHPYQGVALNLAPSLGRLELPDNQDITEYTKAPLPQVHKGGQPALRPTCINAKPKNYVQTPIYSHGHLVEI